MKIVASGLEGSGPRQARANHPPEQEAVEEVVVKAKLVLVVHRRNVDHVVQ